MGKIFELPPCGCERSTWGKHSGESKSIEEKREKELRCGGRERIKIENLKLIPSNSTGGSGEGDSIARV